MHIYLHISYICCDFAPDLEYCRMTNHKQIISTRDRKSRTYHALISHLSRTYHALNFACIFVGIIYVVYNTEELVFLREKDKKIRKSRAHLRMSKKSCTFAADLREKQLNYEKIRINQSVGGDVLHGV